MLELDHVFCLVGDPDRAVQRLQRDGWVLDAGQAHRGQGTRNRRLLWPEQYFELLWVTNAAEARANPLRLDRRADWSATGASPFGLALRGRVESASADEFWLYDALGPRIWIHRDNERHPERPLVFVLEADEQQMRQRRRQPHTMSEAMAHRRPGALFEVRLRGPSAPSLPPFTGPPVRYDAGPNLLELVVGGESPAMSVTDILIVRGQLVRGCARRPESARCHFCKVSEPSETAEKVRGAGTVFRAPRGCSRRVLVIWRCARSLIRPL